MGLGSRQARLHHTAAVQKDAVTSEDYWDFKPDQPVMTVDGVSGIVTAVLDGPVPGNEAYEVRLDNGLGGGQYTASQLRAAEHVTAGEHHTATEDYPELGTVISDRPDPAKQRFTAARVIDFSVPDDEVDGL